MDKIRLRALNCNNGRVLKICVSFKLAANEETSGMQNNESKPRDNDKTVKQQTSTPITQFNRGSNILNPA
ncbi:hypothetical protein J6590_066215 [Homalodisca vitripennis]|nr:hypothetical protein J6590_066215 [Homalodisca vitripennis]